MSKISFKFRVESLKFLGILIVILSTLNIYAERQRISLAGEWKFGQDKKETILLPGSMPERHKGEIVSAKTKWIGSIYDSSYYYNPYMAKYRRSGNIKIPFFLTPEYHYVGKAWYSRTIEIPKGWKKRTIHLYLERPHIVTTLWVNGKEVGTRNSLCVAHEYDITDFVKTGTNELSICVDNNPKLVCVGNDSHSVTDQTQGCWNGIVGKMELIAMPKKHIERLEVFPNVKKKSILVRLYGAKLRLSEAKLQISVEEPRATENKQISSKTTQLSDSTFEIQSNDLKNWDEFHPNLYKLTITFKNGDEVSTTFGMREIEVKGKSIYLNGNKIQLRGTVENCCFPKTGYASMDLDEWMRIFKKCKEYGLNHMRFHSYCPPEVAFEAADIVGFYLQPEGPSWPNHGVSLGRGEYIDTYLMDETKRMTEAYGNHPSFTMLACGNEPRGNWVQWVSNFVDYWKATDSRRIYTGASVGGGWQWQPKSQYHVKAGGRGLNWDRSQPNASDDYSKAISSFYDKATHTNFTINEPFVAHEMGQWCAFPDFNEISQYTGVYKPKNFEIFRDILNNNHMGNLDRKFLMASGKLQTLCYKYEIERLFRTPDYAGFQLLALNDYSGQGTALEGVLNVFFKEKGYCTAKDFTEFCAPTVILAIMPKFTFENNEKLVIPVEVNNYVDASAHSSSEGKGEVSYSISDSKGKEITNGELPVKEIINGGITKIGTINESLEGINTPAKLTLTLRMGKITNHYDFWVYNHNTTISDSKSVYMTDTLDNKALETLRKGGKVLITAAGKIRYGKDIVQHYLPVFWNTSWFKMRPPHSTGAYIRNEHPVFNNFPTDDWTNLNWWELTNKQQVMQFTEFPADFQPIVQSIDTWFLSRKIGMLFEAKVLGGKLMMTTIDITSNLDKRIVARQLRKSILEYMEGNAFEPQLEIDINLIRNLFEKDAPKINMFTNESPDELKPKIN